MHATLRQKSTSMFEMHHRHHGKRGFAAGRQQRPCALLPACALMLMALGACGGGDSIGANDQASTGGVILEPNIIRGHVRFTNRNPGRL